MSTAIGECTGQSAGRLSESFATWRTPLPTAVKRAIRGSLAYFHGRSATGPGILDATLATNQSLTQGAAKPPALV